MENTDNIEDDVLSGICELLLQQRVDVLRRTGTKWKNLIIEATEIPVQLIQLHVPDIKVICSIQGEDLRLPLLHIAAATNCVESIKCLLDMGYDINHLSSVTKSTALSYAALNDRLESVECLLERNCDVNRRVEYIDGSGSVCDSQGVKCDKNFNNLVCDTNDTVNKQPWCAKDNSENSEQINTYGHEGTDEMLNKNEAERFSMTGGATSLVLGASNAKIVFKLLSSGAKVDPICEYDRGTICITALGAAIKAAAPESVQLLLEAGASLGDICEFNHRHRALDMAICCSKYPRDANYARNMSRLVDLLLSKGADPNLVSHDKTLLQNLVVADRSVDVLLMKKLCRAGADIELKCTPNGHTLLTLSILHGKEEQVKMLLNYNCKLNYYIILDKSYCDQTRESPHFNPIELSLYLSEKDIEWATSILSWDPDFFLFLTRQLSIAEMLLTCGIRPPADMGTKLKQYTKQLNEFHHSEKIQVKSLCDRLSQLLEKITNASSLEDLSINAIRNTPHMNDRPFETAVYKLGLPKPFVEKCFIKRLESVPLPKRKFGLLI